jgi:hypothetical protein
MRKNIQSLLLLAIFSLGCISAGCETTNALKFFIVSDQKNEGGKFIDTPTLPNVGYISATADLIVTNLRDVYREKRATSAIIDGKVVPSQPPLGLAVALRPADAMRFTALTEKAVGKRLLVTLGDKPLTAPRVVAPIETDRFSIDFTTESELTKTQDELKKLIPAGYDKVGTNDWQVNGGYNFREAFRRNSSAYIAREASGATNIEQSGAADANQLLHSETNQIPGAAGSHR